MDNLCLIRAGISQCQTPESPIQTIMKVNRMDISGQKICIICGLKKPIAAFGYTQNKINAICLMCREKNVDDGEGGSGFQVNIVDKLATIEAEQKQAQQDSIEHSEAIIERLDAQTERSHQQDSRKNYSTGLFTDHSDDDSFCNIDRQSFQKQTRETTQTKSDQAAPHSKTESHEKSKTNQTHTHFHKSLFSNNEQEQSAPGEQNAAVADHPDSDTHQKPHSRSTAKNNATMISRSLFGAKTHIPAAETLRVASGEKTAATTTQQHTETAKQPVNQTDEAATRFINTLLRSPGRR